MRRPSADEPEPEPIPDDGIGDAPGTLTDEDLDVAEQIRHLTD